MSTYQDEIFNYLTKKDNFFSAYEIYQEFPGVKKNLIKQFWLSVKDELTELSEKTDWKIEVSENVFETYSSLSIRINDNFYVAYEKLHGQTYHGLWIDNDNKQLDRIKINDYASNIESLNWMKKYDYWLGCTLTGTNFDSIDTLKKILPDNRVDFAKELATLLYELANELNNDILVMSKMINK